MIKCSLTVLNDRHSNILLKFKESKKPWTFSALKSTLKKMHGCRFLKINKEDPRRLCLLSLRKNDKRQIEDSLPCDRCLLWTHFVCASLKSRPKNRNWFSKSCRINTHNNLHAIISFSLRLLLILLDCQ